MADQQGRSLSQSKTNPLTKVTGSQLAEYRDEGGNPYKKRYVAHRIQLDDIYLSDGEAMGLMQAIGNNQNSVVIGNAILIKCSSVTAIEPRWSAENPPTRPKVSRVPTWDYQNNTPIYKEDPVTARLAAYWDEVFGGQNV